MVLKDKFLYFTMKKIKTFLRRVLKSENVTKSDYLNSCISKAYDDEKLKLILGKILANQINLNKGLHESEFSIFSQWGDDGLIQYVINKIGLEEGFFIEFGVENYVESNTRFLMMNNNWSGLVLDGNRNNIDSIIDSEYYWKFDLKAKCEFITAENINDILLKNTENRHVDLLHIDIDGNDYWVWKAIHVIEPTIVIVEYNSVFGDDRAITIPYKRDFFRTEAHYSNLYAGSSLKALTVLAKEKGYELIGCNKAGNNAYFIHKNYSSHFRILSVSDAFISSKFREARTEAGVLNYPPINERMSIIKGLPIYNVLTNSIENL